MTCSKESPVGFERIKKLLGMYEIQNSELIPDLNTPEFYDNFYTYYPALLEKGVYKFSDSNYYGVFGYEMAKQILRDSKTFVSDRLQKTDKVLVGANSDMHTANKKLVYNSLSFLQKKRTIEDLELIQQILDKIFKEALKIQGEFNPIEWLVNPFVFTYLSKSMGLTEMGSEYDILEAEDEVYKSRLDQVNLLFGNLNLITDIASSCVEKGTMSEQLNSTVSEIGAKSVFTDEDTVRFIRLLLLAGLDTTSSFLGSSILLIGKEGMQLNLNSENMKSFLSETLRFYSPAQFTFRTAADQMVVNGYTIPKKSVVAVSIGAANRDPSVFEEPDKFKMDRHGPGHIAFGLGKHQCIGEQLAMLLGEAFINKYILHKDCFELLNYDFSVRNSVFSFGISKLNARVMNCGF